MTSIANAGTMTTFAINARSRTPTRLTVSSMAARSTSNPALEASAPCFCSFSSIGNGPAARLIFFSAVHSDT
jgi:hypothetical protein